MDIYSRCVNAREKLDAGAGRPLPLVPGVGRRAEAAVRRLRRPQGGGRACSTTTTCCSTGTPCWPIPQAGDAVRKQFDCVLVDEYQDTNALQAEILYQLSPGGQGADRGGRRRPVDLLLPRGHGPQHPRFSQALSRHDDRHAGAELPQHAADPRRHQPGDRPGHASDYTKNLWSQRTEGAAAGPGRPARTRTSRPTSSSGGSWSIARRASTCAARRCCFARRTTACCWKPSWPAATSPFTSTAG